MTTTTTTDGTTTIEAPDDLLAELNDEAPDRGRDLPEEGTAS